MPRNLAQFGRVVEKINGAIELCENNTDLTLNIDSITYTVGPNFRPMTQAKSSMRLSRAAMIFWSA